MKNSSLKKTLFMTSSLSHCYTHYLCHLLSWELCEEVYTDRVGLCKLFCLVVQLPDRNWLKFVLVTVHSLSRWQSKTIYIYQLFEFLAFKYMWNKYFSLVSDFWVMHLDFPLYGYSVELLRFEEQLFWCQCSLIVELGPLDAVFLMLIKRSRKFSKSQWWIACFTWMTKEQYDFFNCYAEWGVCMASLRTFTLIRKTGWSWEICSG